MTNREIQYAIELARIKEKNPRKRVELNICWLSKKSLDTLLYGLTLAEAQEVLAAEFNQAAKKIEASLDHSAQNLVERLRFQKLTSGGYGSYVALFDEESDTEWEARCEAILRREKKRKEEAARRLAREKASLKKEIQALQERLDSLG